MSVGKLGRVLRDLDESGVRPIVIASHPRSGTHLCIDTLRLNFTECATQKHWFERADRLYLDLDVAGNVGRGIQTSVIGRVLQRADRPLIKTHALPSLTRFCNSSEDIRLDGVFAEWLRQNASMVYVYRDGRESICSFHQFAAQSSPAARVSISEFMRQQVHGMSRVRAWALHVKTWLQTPNVRVLTMEQLLKQTDRSVGALGRSLGLRSPGREIQRPPKAKIDVFSRTFRRIVPRPHSTAILLAKGGGDSWREQFTEADREFFHQEAGQLLIELGYEDSDAWVTTRTQVVRTPTVTTMFVPHPQPA